ncbi:hypothetical protein [Jannaschia pohangensis]|uniref:hypothetical protein n=1 Tax=Jannaschia pohangensis TaxID=390807 RepID=UPI000B88C1F2|nr:hypothetical protein [Jannaschia pohangensis]
MFFAAMVFHANPVAAQGTAPEIGACAVVAPNGEVTDFATCERLPDLCGPEGCDLYFRWPSGSLTVVSSATPDMAAGTRINGKPAQTISSRPVNVGGSCLRNTESARLFCWDAGVGAQTSGAPESTLPAQPAPAATSPASLARLQGLYRLSSSWSCRADQIGMDGGAMAVEGDKLMAVESVCTLGSPSPVGATGAVLTRAECSGEGEAFSEDMILFRDDTSLTIIRPAGKITWMPCP